MSRIIFRDSEKNKLRNRVKEEHRVQGRHILDRVERCIQHKTPNYLFFRDNKELFFQVVDPEREYVSDYILKDSLDWKEFLEKIISEENLRDLF